MDSALNLIATALLVIATFVVIMNWKLLFGNLRNKFRGIKKHSSMVNLVAQILAILGAFASSQVSGPVWLSPLYFWGVALSDPALILLPYFLLARIFYNRRV